MNWADPLVLICFGVAIVGMVVVLILKRKATP
jgi:hypothetical protein